MKFQQLKHGRDMMQLQLGQMQKILVLEKSIALDNMKWKIEHLSQIRFITLQVLLQIQHLAFCMRTMKVALDMRMRFTDKIIWLIMDTQIFQQIPLLDRV
ncbi:MAG: hypothetical protein EBR82_48040 [Caulobacteraceae bacterium]|nr:hypothetical protein [Caulobacteraceae bacterium]